MLILWIDMNFYLCSVNVVQRELNDDIRRGFERKEMAAPKDMNHSCKRWLLSVQIQQ